MEKMRKIPVILADNPADWEAAELLAEHLRTEMLRQKPDIADGLLVLKFCPEGLTLTDGRLALRGDFSGNGIIRLSSGKIWPLQRPLDHNFPRVGGLCRLQEFFFFRARSLQLLQQLEFFPDQGTFLSLREHGIQENKLGVQFSPSQCGSTVLFMQMHLPRRGCKYFILVSLCPFQRVCEQGGNDRIVFIQLH